MKTLIIETEGGDTLTIPNVVKFTEKNESLYNVQFFVDSRLWATKEKVTYNAALESCRTSGLGCSTIVIQKI